MASVKLVSEIEWDAIHAAICVGENIPREEPNGYKVEVYLDKASCNHPTLGYFIPQDLVTEQYTTDFDDTLPNENNLLPNA